MKRIMRFAAIVLPLAVAASCGGKSGKVLKVNAEPTAMLYQDFDRMSVTCAKDPTVIRLADEYFLYYSEAPYEPEKMPSDGIEERMGWHAGVAKSSDLVNWTKISDVDLRSSDGTPIGNDAAPCVKIIDGVIHMFYQRTWDVTSMNAIWHATSTDGIRFDNVDDGPMFVPHNKWASSRAIDAEVYRVGDKLILLYATRDKETGSIQLLGMAEAPYGCDYAPDKWTEITVDEPLLKPEYGWEGKCLEASSVLYRDGVWYLFYAGSYNHASQQLGLATSTDGYHFTRVDYFDGFPGLFYKMGEPGTWNQCESGHPGVFEDNDGTVYLFYQGKDTAPGYYKDYSLSALKLSFGRRK